MAAVLPSTNPCCSSPCSGLSVTVLAPLTPITGSCGFKAGDGPPEGVEIGNCRGQLYTDDLTGTKYTFIGVAGTTTGWV